MVPEHFQPKQTKAKKSKGGKGAGSMFAQSNIGVFDQVIYNFVSIKCCLRTLILLRILIYKN